MNRRTVPLVVAVVVLTSCVGVAPTFAQNQQNVTPVSLVGDGANSKVSVNQTSGLNQVVYDMLEKAGVSYILPAFTTIGTVKLHDVPFPTALAQVLGAAVPPMTYRTENGIYIIFPKPVETPVAPAPAITMPATTVNLPPNNANTVLDALRMQEAQLEIKRDVAIATKNPDYAAIGKINAELKAVRTAITRRAHPEIEALASLKAEKSRLIAQGFRKDSQKVKEIDQQILLINRGSVLVSLP